MNATPPALSGLKVLEIAGGAAAAYCGRLLCDAGADVSVIALHDASRLAGLVRNPTNEATKERGDDTSADDTGDDADRLPPEIERVFTGGRPWQWLSVMHGRERVA